MLSKLKYRFPVVLLAIIGIATSLFLFWIVHGWEKSHQRYEFESRVLAYSNALENTLNEYVGALLFLGDYFDNTPAVSRRDFENMVKSILPRYPGIRTFGWNPLVKDEDRAKYESAAKMEGIEGFQFTERSASGQQVRAARRPEYVVVYHMYPLEGNEAALGFDIASTSGRRSAIERGFETGRLSATERITLVQETGNQYGVLLLRPVYHPGMALTTPEDRHAARKGFVVEVLRIGQLMEVALRGFADEGISVALYDSSSDAGKSLLHYRYSQMDYSPDELFVPEKFQSDLSGRKIIDFAERRWEILLSATPFYISTHRIWQSWIVLYLGLLMTLILVLYLLRKIEHEAAIELTVEKQAHTNQLLADEIKVRSAAEHARDETIHQLQKAIDEVTKLRGILPICSSCKKIRDDKGYWNQLEHYLSVHSGAEFSHGICPD
ncbi:MAG: hypothetical protein HKN85_00665, partial [Gammaproteobacteria bacterium]|nr:hypothetical protein [Gammaproteobacteria bacterium]